MALRIVLPIPLLVLAALPAATENVSWTHAVGVSGDWFGNLTQTGISNSWDAGAISTKAIASGDGYMEFTPGGRSFMAGLGRSDSSQDYADIEYAISWDSGGMGVYESGSYRGTFPGSYGDRLGVGVEGGVVKYRRNGTVFYTSTVVPTYPLLVDTSLATSQDGTAAEIKNVVIAGQLVLLHTDPENVSWTDLVGVSVSGNSLTKTGGTGWSEGAVSTRFIASGDGYMEFTATETNTYRMAGLGSGNASQHYADIEYAVYLRADGTVKVYESGAPKGAFGTYAPGDRLRVGVESGVVKYRKNDAAFYTSKVAPTYPLLVDTSLYTTGATLTNVGIAVFAGKPQETVSWTGAVGVSADAGKLTKTGADGWDAGAISTKSIAPWLAGVAPLAYMEFTATETNTDRMAGLGRGNASEHYADIEYAVYLKADGTFWVYESGTSKGSFGTYSAGDRFRVGVEYVASLGRRVNYTKNGTVFYATDIGYYLRGPLLVDTSLYQTGATLASVGMAGDLQESVSWTSLVGVSAEANNLTKTGSTGWNAGAISTKAIASGEGYMEFTATETSTNRMAGLGNGNASASYTDIEYALFLYRNTFSSSVYVYESGKLVGSFVNAYNTGDRFRVAVEGGRVRYSWNGTVFYTSTVSPTYPLLVDTSLYHTGATLGNVVMAGNLQENVSWTSAVGVSANANDLSKTGANGWNAGAISTRSVVSGNGYMEFTATETNSYRMAGLGNGDASQSYTDIEFAVYLRADGTVRVYESGTSKGAFGSYAAGDRFRVGVESGVVKYRKNGKVFYTSTAVPTYPLLVDTALYSRGATLENVALFGNLN